MASFRKQEIGKAALRSAVRQHRRRRHEPQPARVIVNSLGVAASSPYYGDDAGHAQRTTPATPVLSNGGR